MNIRKKKDCWSDIDLCEQYSVDNAILTRAAHDAGAAKLGLDDCTLGEQVPAHVVRVCRVLLHGLDLCFFGLAGFGIGDVRKQCPEGTDLVIPAERTDNPVPLFADMGICRFETDFRPSLHLCRATPAAGNLSY